MDVGTDVWVKSDDAVWAPGVVLDCQEMHVTGVVKVKVASGEIVTRRYLGDGDDLNEIFLRNKRRDFSTLACLIVLEYLHEPALLHALSERFAHDRIYTSIGDILLAVNPFKDLDLYTDAVIQQYKAAMLSTVSGTAALDAPDACPPHVFAIAGKAFSGLLRPDAKNQSILVSGESGSGKTESTKFLMKFLTSVGHDFSAAAMAATSQPPRSTSSDSDIAPAGDIMEIGKRILQTNPILESFGNARTIRNDNSSRFGKFIKIQFDAQNQIVGAEIASYLLEKVRLIHQSPQERNFHIFYELLEGADNDLLATLGLERGAKYELLNAYGTAPPGSGGSGRGMSLLAKRKSPLAAQYSKRYAQTVQAFTDTGVEEIERTLIFQILGALLHLGNLNFEQVSSAGAPEEAAAVTETSMFHLEKCAELLGVSVEKLTSLLLTREITAGSDIVKLKLNAEQSKDASRSFAKAIYGRLFTWLVRRLSDGINYREYLTALEQNEIKTIGILDIFGFESLEENGFEQLCINYANERLQAQFNEFVFIKEQDIYVSQGIDWRSISYPSNAACLALFDEKVNGLFSLLDQECMMPKGSDQALSTKYYRSHGGPDITESLLQPQLSQRYTLPLLVTSFGRYLQHSTSSTVSDKDDDDKTRPFTASKMDRVNKQFVIKHFAGKVTYRVDQFLEKNQDSLPTDACLLLTTSENDIVSMIGAEEGVEDAPESNGRGRARSKSRSSLLRAPSVSFQFRGQLDLLIDEIGHTEAHYIRCLKPNEDKKPRAFDRHRMVEQLRSVGVLEALRIARAGYSARLSHETFVDSFSCYRYKLEKAGQQMPTELPDLCKALLAALLDEVNAEKKDGAPPVKTLLKVDNAKFNEMVRGYGVQFGSSIVFCKTNAYNAFIRLRLRVRDQAARVLQRYGRGFLHRRRFLKQRRAARIIQTRVRRHQAMQFFSRIRQLRRRRAAHCIERYLQLALANKRVVDEKIRHHQLKRAFANFQLGCKLKSQEVDELLAQARHIEEEQASNFVEDEDTFSDDRHQAEKYMRPPSSQGKGIARNVRSTENIERQRSSRRVRSSSDEPEVEQGEDQSLRHEIERLKKLLGQQKSQPPALQRKPSSRSGRSRVGSLDVSSARRYRSRRSMSIEKSDGVSEADDELDDSEEHAPPRRAQSVKLARDADHVTKLTKRIEELDAKCRQLERLVSRPPGPYDYPPSRSGSSRRRNSIANSDGSNGGYPDYPYENQSNGGGSSSGVENLIWSIQQQMDALRQSVAAKVDDDSAAIQARHDAHAMSFASSQPTRSSTITSNGSSTNQPFDGPLPEDAEMNGYPSLPSPSRTNSDPHLGYRGYGYQTPPTPASEASFRMGGVPRHPNSANGYPFPAAPPVVKWSRSTHCHECNDPFTLFVRRHHCRMCGNSFCHEHSSRRVALLGMGFDDEPQRVCDACFADYQAHASSSPDYFPPMPTPTSMRGAAGPPAHFGQPMYRQRSFSQQYYPPPPQHAQSYHHLQVPRTPQRYQQQPYYGGWAPPPPAAPSSHTSAA